MGDTIQASVREGPPLTVIDLAGEATTPVDDVIADAYREASYRGAQNVLLNFSGIRYLDSAGISTVIGILRQALAAEQHLLITGLTPHYRKVFEIVGLSRCAPVFDSEIEARAAVAGG